MNLPGLLWESLELGQFFFVPPPPCSTAKAAPASAPLGAGLCWAGAGQGQDALFSRGPHFLDWPCVLEGLWRWGRCEAQTARQALGVLPGWRRWCP